MQTPSKPDKWFLKSLTILDPLLSVRWGAIHGNWVIERKGLIPVSEVEFLIKREARLKTLVSKPSKRKKYLNLYQNVAEELVSARSGRRVVMITKVLSAKVYDLLCMGDLQRYGGYSRYADELEKQESREAADKARVEENERHAFNLEVADMVHFIWRKKESKLLDGHRNMNYLLHGKESNKPLIEIASS